MTDSNSHVFSYYPGCSQTAMHKAYDVSTRNVARALGLTLIELDDWNCCGATAYVAIREKRAFVLSARNLAIAEKTGHPLVTGCSGCYVVLKKASKYMAENPELAGEIQEALAAGGMGYKGTVQVRHFLDITVNEVGEAAIRGRVTRPLTGLKVAPYHGCQISRPFSEIDDEEFPQSLDKVATWLGAEAVPFSLKSKCCGGLMMTTQPDIGKKLTGRILRAAKKQGAHCIITCCPLCHFNLESYQADISAAMGFDCTIPVLYFTQLMGYAFGLTPSEIVLKDALTPAEEILTEKVAHP